MNMLKFIRKILHTHTLIDFKWSGYPLVAAYCKTCGCIMLGNSIYYDGSRFQRTLYSNDAIKFIDDNIRYIESRHNSIDKNFDIIDDMMRLNNIVLDNYESVDVYKAIKNNIIKVNDRRK